MINSQSSRLYHFTEVVEGQEAAYEYWAPSSLSSWNYSGETFQV